MIRAAPDLRAPDLRALGRPPDFEIPIPAWAAARAEALLNHTALVCDGQPHRICEIELYLQGPAHPDPFVHGAERQRRPGGWYFHRAGSSYRGGTFKGLDFSTGGPEVGCGWLLRSVEAADGCLIDGSCNVVDHMLALAGVDGIAPLDRASPDALEPTSRLHLRWHRQTPRPVLRTPRVGLTLKRAGEHPTMPDWIGRRLRFLTEPRRIKKGRAQTIAALLADGMPAEDIHALTGSPRRSVERAARTFAAGVGADLSRWFGRPLAAADIHGIYGATLSTP